MDFRAIFYIIGILLAGLSGTMLLPVLIDFAHNSSDWKVFAVAQAFTGFTGFSLIFVNRQKKLHLGLRETFLLTPLSYLFITAFSALPFCFAEIQMPFTTAFFEAMSGITTTGATAIPGLDHLPRGILFWRALLEYIGGIGFLVIALAIFPMLQISGMQIFKTQSFEVEKVLPSASQMALAIWLVYNGMTFICTLALYFAGMPLFDALCHAIAAISTGGFSTSDFSIGFYKSHLIDVIIILFMLAGAPALRALPASDPRRQQGPLAGQPGQDLSGPGHAPVADYHGLSHFLEERAFPDRA
jgi:trk system potassium uptake protein TrkH